MNLVIQNIPLAPFVVLSLILAIGALLYPQPPEEP